MRPRVVLITGSGRGIGAEIAWRCAEAGYAVCVNYLENERGATETYARVSKFGQPCHLSQADVRLATDVERLVTETVDHLCGLDVLINNVHTPFTPKPFAELAWDELQGQYDGIIRSAFLCTKAALPYLRKGISPASLNMSSVTAVHPQLGFLHRDTAKAALETFTRSMSLELAEEGIRVNALSIGWTYTEQLSKLDREFLLRKQQEIPLKRFAEPCEIAEAALFLISPGASYITGSIFSVDGGLGALLQSRKGVGK